MDLEKNKQRIEILAAEIEELKNGGGGGGDLSAYLTKDEASNTYETQSAASSALALKADKSTTYTKSEVDSAIAAAAGGGLPAYVNLPTDANPYFPEDKMEILEKHLPFTTTSSPTDISPVYLFIGTYGNSYIYREFGEKGFIAEVSINKSTRKITSTTKDGGGVIYDVNSANYMRYALSRPQDTLSGENNIYKQILFITGAVDLNNSPYSQPKMVVCQSDATATTLTNCPTTKAFYMFSNNYANKPSQTIFEYDNPSIFYRRTRIDTNTWTDWYKFSADIGTASSTETLPSAGTGTTFDTGIEWTYIQTKNDFILDSSGEKIKFRYSFTKGSKLHYFGYILDSDSTTRIAHLELGAPTGSGTTALATWISSGAIPTT